MPLRPFCLLIRGSRIHIPRCIRRRQLSSVERRFFQRPDPDPIQRRVNSHDWEMFSLLLWAQLVFQLLSLNIPKDTVASALVKAQL